MPVSQSVVVVIILFIVVILRRNVRWTFIQQRKQRWLQRRGKQRPGVQRRLHGNVHATLVGGVHGELPGIQCKRVLGGQQRGRVYVRCCIQRAGKLGDGFILWRGQQQRVWHVVFVFVFILQFLGKPRDVLRRHLSA